MQSCCQNFLQYRQSEKTDPYRQTEKSRPAWMSSSSCRVCRPLLWVDGCAESTRAKHLAENETAYGHPERVPIPHCHVRWRCPQLPDWDAASDWPQHRAELQECSSRPGNRTLGDKLPHLNL